MKRDEEAARVRGMDKEQGVHIGIGQVKRTGNTLRDRERNEKDQGEGVCLRQRE